MLPRHLSPEVAAALQSVRFIAQHIKDADKDNEVSYYSDVTKHASVAILNIITDTILVYNECNGD